MTESNAPEPVVKAPIPYTSGICGTPEIIIMGYTFMGNDKDGDIITIQHEDGEVRYGRSGDGKTFTESAVMKPQPIDKLRREKYRREKYVAELLLPDFNKENSASFMICKEKPEPGISDVYILDAHAGQRIAVQVTCSDADATGKLKRNKYFDRNGDYQTISKAIKERIVAKQKYEPALRKEAVLVLDGWPGVTKKVLERFRDEEKDFLTKAGWGQIWFVGTVIICLFLIDA